MQITTKIPLLYFMVRFVWLFAYWWYFFWWRLLPRRFVHVIKPIIFGRLWAKRFYRIDSIVIFDLFFKVKQAIVDISLLFDKWTSTPYNIALCIETRENKKLSYFVFHRPNNSCRDVARKEKAGDVAEAAVVAVAKVAVVKAIMLAMVMVAGNDRDANVEVFLSALWFHY